MEELFVTENLNIGKILEEIRAVGTTSVRTLDEDFRISLLEEAHHYSYEPEEEVVGSGEVGKATGLVL